MLQFDEEETAMESSVDRPIIGQEGSIAAIVAANALPPSYFVSIETAVLHEMIEASKEALQRAHAEMHIIAEFATKIAEAHTAAGVAKAYEDCIQQQSGIMRQEGDRILAHGRDVLNKASEIASSYWPRPALP